MNQEQSLFTFAEAVVFMAKEKSDVKTVAQWFKYSASGVRDPRLPSNPMVHYRKTGEWPEKNGFSVFLSSNTLSNKAKAEGFLSYSDAKELVRILELCSKKEYVRFIKEFAISDLPLAPEKFYPKQGIEFKWREYLAPKFMPLEDFLTWFGQQNFKYYKDWQNIKKKDRPKRVPSNPFSHYGKRFEELKKMAAEQ